MIDSNIPSREEYQNQKQLSISNGTTHDEQYPYLSDIKTSTWSVYSNHKDYVHSRMLLAKSLWEATNYSGSLEKCKKRLTELYGEDWDEHVKLKDHFRSLKYYYIWALLISHRQQWNDIKK